MSGNDERVRKVDFKLFWTELKPRIERYLDEKGISDPMRRHFHLLEARVYAIEMLKERGIIVGK